MATKKKTAKKTAKKTTKKAVKKTTKKSTLKRAKYVNKNFTEEFAKHQLDLLDRSSLDMDLMGSAGYNFLIPEDNSGGNPHQTLGTINYFNWGGTSYYFVRVCAEALFNRQHDKITATEGRDYFAFNADFERVSPPKEIELKVEPEDAENEEEEEEEDVEEEGDEENEDEGEEEEEGEPETTE